MAIATTTQKNALAQQYGNVAPYGALFSADPGTAGNATNELTGGSPAYGRLALNWGAPSNGTITGNATFNVAAGSTVAFVGVTVSNVAATNDVRDRVSVTSQAFASQGTYAVTTTYTQT